MTNYYKVLTRRKSWSLNLKAHFFKPRDSVPVRLSWQVWPGKIEGLVRACILRYLPIVLYICKLYNWTHGAEPFIFEQGVVYIGRGVVLRGIMGKLFIETVITRGRGDRVSFLPILSLRLSNELLSPERLLIFVRRIIFLLHRESGHNWTRAAEVLLRGGLSQFCGVTDEEWCCSRYLWVTSFGSFLLLPAWHTVAPMNCYWASQRDHPGKIGATIRSKHFPEEDPMFSKHLSSSQTVVNHPCWMWCVCQHSIPNISGFRKLRILTILRLFATTSFYLSKAILRFTLISILPLCCSWQCSADRWFSLSQTNYLAPEQRGWLVTPKKTPTKTLNLNIGGWSHCGV